MRIRGAVSKWVVTSACWLACLAAPVVAVAQDLEVESDARLEGYGDKLQFVDPGNSAMMWAGFIFCAIVALLGMFKDAKRSHLD